MELYDYFRSSAAYRVRIALSLKGLEYHAHPIHLMKDGGQQWSESYRAINPQARVPALIPEEGGHARPLLQSLAIIEYLNEIHPTPPLLPTSSLERAEVRGMALLIACDIHPLNNLSVLNYLTQTLRVTEQQKQDWYRHWITQGFDAFETLLARAPKKGIYCYGNEPTLADICLIPQVFNALRFECSLEKYPHIQHIYEHCQTLPAFQAAHPDKQHEVTS